ncbi:MAG TPA: 2-octaprenyl-6-methoxyphenyl hydroxylase [Gammaproteobacteria bacterium]|nr:2-octaprenyl-6-methoxyphenyl hydroxylase [Gammaproteobacteria bacterium]
MKTEVDVLIVGGGLVSASLACALGQAGVRVCMVEASPLRTDLPPGYDERSIALAQGSQRIFSGLGLWPTLQDRVCPIHTIHVSDRGHFGFTRLRREEEGVPALGYVATARVLGKALLDRIDELEGVEVLAPAELIDFQVGEAEVEADLLVDNNPVHCTAKLLVAADGAQSSIRTQLGIETTQRDYGQTAVIANVTTDRPHANVAYERFTDTGPMALLPMTEQRSALVWTVRSEQSEALMALDDAEFLARLQTRFGYRLGRFLKVGKRQAYPLFLLRARESVRPRMALIGNAIHTLHPVAGQGFNLGLRDVATLAEVILDARRNGRDIGGSSVLERYADWRQADQQRVAFFTDSMVRLFGQTLPPVTWIRDAGMLALDICPPAKRWFGRLTMGRAGRLPRLACGLDLS